MFLIIAIINFNSKKSNQIDLSNYSADKITKDTNNLYVVTFPDKVNESKYVDYTDKFKAENPHQFVDIRHLLKNDYNIKLNGLNSYYIFMHSTYRNNIIYGGNNISIKYIFRNRYVFKNKSFPLFSFYIKSLMYTNNNSLGGNISVISYFYNKKTNQHITITANAIAFGKSNTKEVKEPRFDPTTNIVHIESMIYKDTIYTTKTTKSDCVVRVDNILNNKLFQVAITEQNFKRALSETNMDINIENWELSESMVQIEFEEVENGDDMLDISISDFEINILKENNGSYKIQ